MGMQISCSICTEKEKSVSEVIGYIKGKSAIAVARQFGNKKRNFNGEQFWANGLGSEELGEF